ncbi:MAG: ScyD/ScyE family protein, partial [Acidobacteriota bacterium]
MNTHRTPTTLFVKLISIFTIVVIAGAASFAQSVPGGVTQVVGGLHSPRGLSFGPGDILYVAEAGDAENEGAIIAIRNSMSRRATARTIVGGLARVGGDGEFIGVSGISVVGRGDDAAIIAIFGESPQAIGDERFGGLVRFGQNGTSQTLANVGYFDFLWTAANPDPREPLPDANPYGVLAVPGHIYVTDAGANTLDEVLADGSVRVLAYFPDEAIRDAIPTCVAKGPDGFLYVGTLALVDSFVIGPSAKVWRLDPSQANLTDPASSPKTLWATGLYPINGCTFGPDGNFYASQLFTNPAWPGDFGNPQGDVVRIPFTSPTTHTSLTDGAL